MSKQTPKERLSGLLNGDAFDMFPDQDSIEKALVQACKDLLLSRDYKVIDPPSNDLNVKTSTHLRDRFYALVSRKYAGKYACLGRGKTYDNAIMRNFVESRMKGGATRKVALLECARIMEAVVTHSEKIGIEGQVVINMFDPGLFSWVVEKGIRIINGQFDLEETRYADALCDAVCNIGMEGKSWAMFGPDEEDTDGKEDSSN